METNEIPEPIEHGIIPEAVFVAATEMTTLLFDHLEILKNDEEVEGASMRVSLLANCLLVTFSQVCQKLDGMTGTEVYLALDCFNNKLREVSTKRVEH